MFLLIKLYLLLCTDTQLPGLRVNVFILPHLCICTIMETYIGSHTTLSHVHRSSTCIREDHVEFSNEND